MHACNSICTVTRTLFFLGNSVSQADSTIVKASAAYLNSLVANGINRGFIAIP